MSKAVWCPVSVLCSNVELVLLPGHFLNRAAGVGLSKAVCCPVSVLCSNVVLVLCQDISLTGLQELGCPRVCAVSCECCVVIVCLFNRQDSCVTGLLVLVCPRTHHYNTATPCTPHIRGQPNSSSPVNKMSWQINKHSMTTQHTQVTAHILGQPNTSSPIKNVLASEPAQHYYTAHTGHNTPLGQPNTRNLVIKMSWRVHKHSITLPGTTYVYIYVYIYTYIYIFTYMVVCNYV